MSNWVKRNKNAVLLGFMILVQVALIICFASKKEGYFIDEILTFSLSNREGTGYYELPANSWKDLQWYLENMTVQAGNIFNFNIPYQNQVQDVSPPLYYMLIHAVCSFFPGQFSYWMGIAINIFFYVGSILLLYFLAEKMFNDKQVGLLIAGLFGITYGAINSAIFIRMYMQATFMLLTHLSVYIHFLDREKVPAYGYVLLAMSAILGCMTQYYFLIGAVFLGIWYSVKTLFRKRYFNLIKYGVFVLVAAVGAYLFFPAIVHHLLHSGRGTQALDTLSDNHGYFSDLLEMLEILNEQLFAGCLMWMIGISILLTVILVAKKKFTICNNGIWIPIIITAVGYFCAVTKVAPYQTDRYIMPIFPLVYLMAFGYLYTLLKNIVNKKTAIIICTVVLMGLSVLKITNTPFYYLYEGYNQRNVAEEYVDEKCVVISEDHGYWYYDIQALTQYEQFFWLEDVQNQEAIEKMKTEIINEDGFVLYLRNTWSEQQFHEFFTDTFGDEWIFGKHTLPQPERYVVYHCKKLER